MKKGLWLFALIAFIAIAGTASAQFSFGNYAHQINFSELATSQAVNFFLVFLLVFAFVLLVLKDVFKQSYGSAVIISMVVGIMGSLGLLYYYGPIIPRIGKWIVIAALAVVCIIFWHLTRESANKKGLLWILSILSLLWFFFGRKLWCASLPGDTCFVIDMVAAAILIIAFFTILFKLFSGWRNAPPSGGGGGGERAILRIAVQGRGITKPSQGRDYPCKLNRRVKVEAQPSSGAQFSHWVLDGSNLGRGRMSGRQGIWNTSTIVVMMNTDHTLTAVFSGAAAPQPGGGGGPGRQTNVLSISKTGPGAGRGNTMPRPGTYKIGKNSIMRLRAIGPNFDHWTINGATLRSPDQAIRMDKNYNAVAEFGAAPTQPGRQTVVLAMASSGTGRGKTIPRAGVHQTFRKGVTTMIRAIPDQGSVFDHWLLDGSTVRGPVQNIRLTRNVNAVAVFNTQAWGGRPAKNWQALYTQYSNEIRGITSRWKHIPAKNSNKSAEKADYVRWNNNIRRMKAIENEARKAGIVLH